MVIKRQNDLQRQLIYCMKFFSIFSVICAHVTTITANNSVDSILYSRILGIVGSAGVGTFLLISGFLFANNKDHIIVFIKKKLYSIVIPWLFTGTMVFLYVTLRKGGLTITNYINFMLGNGSYLYFLTILFLCYLITFYLRKNRKILILFCLVSFFSITLTVFNYISINPYLNVFNWLIYFVFGILISNKNLYKIGENLFKYRYFITLTYILLIFTSIKFNISIGYWGKMGFITEINAICVILILSYKSITTYIFPYIGKISFAIYLTHMPIAGIVTAISNHIDIPIIILLRPVIVLCLNILLINLYCIMTKPFLGVKISKKIIGCN